MCFSIRKNQNSGLTSERKILFFRLFSLLKTAAHFQPFLLREISLPTPMGRTFTRLCLLANPLQAEEKQNFIYFKKSVQAHRAHKHLCHWMGVPVVKKGMNYHCQMNQKGHSLQAREQEPGPEIAWYFVVPVRTRGLSTPGKMGGNSSIFPSLALYRSRG